MARAINANAAWRCCASNGCIALRGRQIGRELAPEGPDAPVEALQDALSALGFQPAVQRAGRGRITFCLGNCPYRDAVRENQPAICTLHRGITRGLLDALAPNARLTAFTPHDPDDAGCTIVVSGVAEPAVGE